MYWHYVHNEDFLIIFYYYVELITHIISYFFRTVVIFFNTCAFMWRVTSRTNLFAMFASARLYNFSACMYLQVYTLKRYLACVRSTITLWINLLVCSIAWCMREYSRNKIIQIIYVEGYFKISMKVWRRKNFYKKSSIAFRLVLISCPTEFKTIKDCQTCDCRTLMLVSLIPTNRQLRLRQPICEKCVFNRLKTMIHCLNL